MRVNGIAVGPTDPVALVPVINKALSQGIEVICFETDAPDSNKKAYIGTDNYKAGRHMGEVIGRTLSGRGDIMILTGLPTQMSLNERIRGMKEYMAEKYPAIRIVDTQSSEGDPQKAVTYTENMIQAYPNFKAIIGIDATAGPAMISVWKAKGWQNSNDHMIITFDDMPDNLQGMRDSYIKAIVAQRQSNWGIDVLDLLNVVCNGGSYEKYVDTGSIEVTLNNINTYPNEPSYIEK
jgi:ribose transport system substrate-binding protein